MDPDNMNPNNFLNGSLQFWKQTNDLLIEYLLQELEAGPDEWGRKEPERPLNGI